MLNSIFLYFPRTDLMDSAQNADIPPELISQMAMIQNSIGNDFLHLLWIWRLFRMFIRMLTFSEASLSSPEKGAKELGALMKSGALDQGESHT